MRDEPARLKSCWSLIALALARTLIADVVVRVVLAPFVAAHQAIAGMSGEGLSRRQKGTVDFQSVWISIRCLAASSVRLGRRSAARSSSREAPMLSVFPSLMSSSALCDIMPRLFEYGPNLLTQSQTPGSRGSTSAIVFV